MGLLIKEERLELGLQASQVREAWYGLLKGTLAKYTKKIYFEKGVLTVYTTSPICKHELLMTKNAVMEQMNTILASNLIKQIHIK